MSLQQQPGSGDSTAAASPAAAASAPAVHYGPMDLTINRNTYGLSDMYPDLYEQVGHCWRAVLRGTMLLDSSRCARCTVHTVLA
jgi:hypothetical protein